MVAWWREGERKGWVWGGGHLLCRADSATGSSWGARTTGPPQPSPPPMSVPSRLDLVYRPHHGASDPLEQPRGCGGGGGKEGSVRLGSVRFSELGVDVLKRFYCDAVVFFSPCALSVNFYKEMLLFGGGALLNPGAAVPSLRVRLMKLGKLVKMSSSHCLQKLPAIECTTQVLLTGTRTDLDAIEVCIVS